jgi:hypothetical protein
MRIRIIKKPDPSEFEGIDVRQLSLGRVYNIDSSLAHVLIVCGYAFAEMRAVERNENSAISKNVLRVD